MKITFTFLIIILGSTVFSQKKQIEGFSHPESVIYWKDSLLFVSNIGEQRGDSIHDGYISLVKFDGTIVKKELFSDLDDPKGLCLHDNKLYVSDITKVVAIDLESKEKQSFPGPNAKFLNDITVDDQDNIYVSDMMTSAIYRLKDERLQVWIQDKELENPNGLLFDDGRILIASWGVFENGKVREAKNAALRAVDLETKEIIKLSIDIGNLDGLQKTGEGYFVSDWVNGGVYLVRLKGPTRLFKKTEKSVGDILYLEKHNLLVLPMNLQNRVDFEYLN
ncbi:MAG: hypothetical protein MRY83_15105 [Flavobacteriales bacterium]|nr:hypothetical protein [Flavobacteriales bacterium]